MREYLIECGYQYQTTKVKKVKNIFLTEEEKEFVITSSKDDMNAFQIACLIWPDRQITPLSKETLVVAEHIKTHNTACLRQEDSALGEKYKPPQTIFITCRLINTYTSSNIKHDELTLKNKKMH